MCHFRGGSRILEGGANNPGGGGANIQFCQIFESNCMKLKNFWLYGACIGVPLRSATDYFIRPKTINNDVLTACQKSRKAKFQEVTTNNPLHKILPLHL